MGFSTGDANDRVRVKVLLSAQVGRYFEFFLDISSEIVLISRSVFGFSWTYVQNTRRLVRITSIIVQSTCSSPDPHTGTHSVNTAGW